MADEKRVPQGRLGRLGRMASVGLRSGASLLFKRSGDQSALHAAEVLGTLRGLAAKLGQMAGYVDGVIPEAHREAYEAALATLQAAAPRSDPAAVRRLVEEELGAPLDRLFATFDEAPIASASIGQVHRAVLEDEREVAVKVQHPGVVRALESDLANAGLLESLVTAMGGRKLDAGTVLEALRARFREELDYAMEADHADYFRAVHAGDPLVRIPEVVRERSSGRVLTTLFVRGRTFAEAAAAPEPERRAHAETLWHFVFKGNLVGGAFNADPHPGNYLFHDEGAVTFLDFGCVQRIPDDHLQGARALHLAAVHGDERTFRAVGRSVLATRPGRLEDDALAYLRACFDPLFEAPYRITRAYSAGLVDGMRDLGKLALKTPDEELFHMPPHMIFMNRLQFGFYSVLARLDVEVDYAEIERRFCPEPARAALA